MGCTLQQIIARGNDGDYPAIHALPGHDDSKLLSKYEKDIKRLIERESSSRWTLALLIAELLRSGAWTSFYLDTKALYEKWNDEHGGNPTGNPYNFSGGFAWHCHSVSFFTFLKEKFGLGRTTVYTYLEVVDEFAVYYDDPEILNGKAPYYDILEEARVYQFWQLIEMLSLSYHERLAVQPNWTREEIRAYKRKLRSDEKAALTDVQPAEQKTEVVSNELLEDDEELRFKVLNRQGLISKVKELESNILKLEREKEDLQTRRYLLNNSDIASVKDEFSDIVSKFLQKHECGITFGKRYRAVKSVASELAELILNTSVKDEFFAIIFNYFWGHDCTLKFENKEVSVKTFASKIAQAVFESYASSEKQNSGRIAGTFIQEELSI